MTFERTINMCSNGSTYDCEVFLNFRGADTRRNIVDHLYQRLKDAYVSVYRDDDQLPHGEKIDPKLTEAIERSKIAITIFSKDYASSDSCLKELAHIMECKKTLGLKVIPVFYKVEPSDVRNLWKSFETIPIHELRYDAKIVKSWKEALKEVADLKGWVVDDKSHEGAVVGSVVEKIKSELKKTYMAGNNNLVGIDNLAREIVAMICEDTTDVHVVGFHGVAGVGKTTLAKFIYEQLLEHFDYRSFITNIGEILPKGFEFLQEQLISNDVPEELLVKLNYSNNGMKNIKPLFLGKKVLITLDDSDIIQMRILMDMCSCFSSGSVVLFTTRNSDVVNAPQVTWSHELQEMDFKESLKLICKHAFGRSNPPDGFVAHSLRVVEMSSRVPLALEVIGSTLFRKKKEVWESTLKALGDDPSMDVEKQLLISYKDLDDNEKQVFLQIACFFIGFDKRVATRMWEDQELFPEEALDTLQARSLVKIDDDNKLQMHDLLRDLGKKIAQTESGGEHEKFRKLFPCRKAICMSKARKEIVDPTAHVEGIALDSKAQAPTVQLEELTDSPHVQSHPISSLEHLFGEIDVMLAHNHYTSKQQLTDSTRETIALVDSLINQVNLPNAADINFNSPDFRQVLENLRRPDAFQGMTNEMSMHFEDAFSKFERIPEHLSQIQSTKDTFNHCTQMHAAKVSEIRDLKTELSSDKTALQQTRRDIAQLEVKLTSLKAKECELECKLNNALPTLSDLRDKLERSKSQLFEAQARIDEIPTLVEHIKANHHGFLHILYEIKSFVQKQAII